MFFFGGWGGEGIFKAVHHGDLSLVVSVGNT